MDWEERWCILKVISSTALSRHSFSFLPLPFLVLSSVFSFRLCERHAHHVRHIAPCQYKLCTRYRYVYVYMHSDIYADLLLFVSSPFRISVALMQVL
ncbi:hypothetical protein F4604DRAFT_1723417, partial [Suillus subluteus]